MLSHMLLAVYVDLLHRAAARIVTKRVPSGELNSVSELSPTVRLTKNAESIPLGVFSFPLYFVRFATSDATQALSLFRSRPFRAPEGTLPVGSIWGKTL